MCPPPRRRPPPSCICLILPNRWTTFRRVSLAAKPRRNEGGATGVSALGVGGNKRAGGHLPDAR
eukprot:6739533-Prymnesium_polylepis.1